MKPFAAFALCVAIVGCGSDSPTAPTQSDPTPTPTATVSSVSINTSATTIEVGSSQTMTATSTLSDGTTQPVSDGVWESDNLAVATVALTSSSSVTSASVTGSSVTVTAVSAGQATIYVDAGGQRGTVLITAEPPPPPPGPATTFGPGQHLVGTDILAGRYFSDPMSGCFWERLSGFSGNISDTIANNFIGFDAGQWIVDIAESDLAFETDNDCGTWFLTRRSGSMATITPGMWLVGSQITSGTYQSTVQSGCFWQRLRSFSGRVSEDTIANDFVGTAGTQRVTIASSDKGFESDEDCGTWTRMSGVTSLDHTNYQSQGEILDNWRRGRDRR